MVYAYSLGDEKSLHFMVTRMNLEGIALCEVRYLLNMKYCMNALYGIYKIVKFKVNLSETVASRG